MSGEGEEDLLDDTALLESDPPDPSAPPAPDRAQIEADARRQGWTPREQFRGKPSAWVDAEEFMRRGETILPIVRQQLTESRERQRKTDAELAEIKRKTEEQTRTIQELLEISRSAEARGYERAKRELQARQREAVQSGDVAAYDETQAALQQLEREARSDARAPAKPAADPPPPPAPADPNAIAPEVATFVAANPWFNTNRVLNAAMQDEHIRLLADRPELTLAQNLALAKRNIQREYPKQFGIAPPPPAPPPPPDEDIVDETLEEEPSPVPQPPRQQRRNAVNPPTPAAPREAADPLKINSIADPQERAKARQECQRQMKIIPGLTEADWMRLYNDPHAEGTDFRSGKRA